MGWNELSDPDMRTANFEFSCDVYREGVYRLIPIKETVFFQSVLVSDFSLCVWCFHNIKAIIHPRIKIG